MAETTGGFTSAGLELEVKTLMLASLTQAEALEIGEIAVALGRARNLTDLKGLCLRQRSQHQRLRLKCQANASKAARSFNHGPILPYRCAHDHYS